MISSRQFEVIVCPLPRMARGFYFKPGCRFMIENGYYKVKDAFFSFFIDKYGCVFKYNKGGNRPVFCCFEDTKVKELYGLFRPVK